MQRKTIFTLANLVFFSAMTLNAVCQQTINVASRSANINGLQFDYSIGEMTLVSTEKNAQLIVTQGLLQPYGSGIGTQLQPANITQEMSATSIKVYPNPTQNVLFVESIEDANVVIGYQLFDAAGKMVINESTTWKAGPNKFSLDLNSFAAGAYYLMIRKPEAGGQAQSLSFKIQKTN